MGRVRDMVRSMVRIRGLAVGKDKGRFGDKVGTCVGMFEK